MIQTAALILLLLCQDDAYKAVDKDEIQTVLGKLSSDEFEGRRTGTKGIQKAREYMIGLLKEWGVKSVDGSYEQDWGGCKNILAWSEGSDPELKKEVIILGSHYDHLGLSTKTGEDDKVFNGADDNGSGTCGLMAIAEALAGYGPMRRSVALIWVSGEEKGLWGSNAWTQDPWLPGEAKPVCDINIDMIGRNAPDKLLITPTQARKEHNGLVRLAEKLAPLEGFPQLGSCDDYWSRSDHINFSKNLKIPVTFLFADIHEDYHQSTDDPEKIDVDKIRRVARLVVRMIEDLQADQLDL